VSTFTPKCPEEAKGQYLDDVCYLAGRVHTIRSAGKKLIFYDLVGDNGKIQV
jgi:lysyl-tRNA synthetase class II